MDKAAEDRTISFYPRAFLPDVTPYDNTDFSGTVIQSCQEERFNKLGCLKTSKIVIVGDVAVGKTCLINRFCHQVFDSHYKTTIGVDFEVERFDILHCPFNLQIWDTAGQERFKCITTSYYRGAHVVVLVFELCSLASLLNTPKWLRETLESNTAQPLLFLVGTKKDLMSEAAFQAMEIQAIQFAQLFKAEYWAVSSKTDDNVQDLFFRIASLAFCQCILRENQHPEERKVASNFVKLKRSKVDKRKKAKCSPKCKSL